mmetsp:Transcript_3978/g.11032  ORF Transcript_3978/g.11032 Transcript_3978/m.11032 type:complete len:216 (-) Transcript_3978:258-905(-)
MTYNLFLNATAAWLRRGVAIGGAAVQVPPPSLALKTSTEARTSSPFEPPQTYTNSSPDSPLSVAQAGAMRGARRGGRSYHRSLYKSNASTAECARTDPFSRSWPPIAKMCPPATASAKYDRRTVILSNHAHWLHDGLKHSKVAMSRVPSKPPQANIFPSTVTAACCMRFDCMGGKVYQMTPALVWTSKTSIELSIRLSAPPPMAKICLSSATAAR